MMIRKENAADNNDPLETENLILERFTLRDAVFLKELMNSPGWLQYIGDRGIADVAAAERYIQEKFMTAYAQYGYGFWIVSLKKDGRPIGGCGLIRRDGLDFPDIGFALLPEFSGLGFGFEMAAATLAHARDRLKISRVLGITLPTNTRSIRLLERIGMVYEKMVQLPEDEEALMLFGRTF
jgi:RimJ/RimL family protein N-acetyltransferase